jgi:hypothetical protein
MEDSKPNIKNTSDKYELFIHGFGLFRINNRRNSCLLGIGSSNFSFLLLLAAFVYEIVQKPYKIVDSISCFPYNRMKYALRLTSVFWQIWSSSMADRILPEFQDFLRSRSLVPAKNAPFYALTGSIPT